MIELMLAAALPIAIPHSPFAGEGPKGEAKNLNEIVGGVDFRSENDFRVAVYNEKGNLMANPSFESSMRYYRVGGSNDCEACLTTADAHSGRHSFYARQKIRGFKNFGLVLKPQTMYTVSCYVKSATDKPLNPKGRYGSWQFRGTSGLSAMTRNESLKPVDGTVDANGWMRLCCRIHTGTNHIGKAMVPQIHEVVSWVDFAPDCYYDDIQVEEGAVLTAYRGPALGCVLETGNADPYLVDDRETGPVRLALNGTPGTKATVEVTHRDIMERTAMKPVRAAVEIPAEGCFRLPLGNREDFPKGVNGFAVRVTEADGHVYEDYVRFCRFRFADGKARNRRLQTTTNGSTTWQRREFLPESRFRTLMRIGIGGFSYTGGFRYCSPVCNSKEDLEYLRSFGLEDYFGNGGFGRPKGSPVVGVPETWEGTHGNHMKSYPEGYLKAIEEGAYNVAKSQPWVTFYTLDSEPQGHHTTLMNGKLEEYAKKIHAYYTGVKRGNPKAVLQPYGAYNMEQLGRGWVGAMMEILHRKYPEDDFPVLDIHSYRAFPESPSLEHDFTAYLDVLARAGYPDVKIKIGEGNYYFPMCRRSINMLPWTGVSEHDGYSTVIIPGYDLGFGEKIGAALNTRESLVYYRFMDRIHSACSWNPLFIDNRTPTAWTIANATLLEMLGDADRFLADIRFSPMARAYCFSDGHGSTVVATWRVDERFDRGLDQPTTLRFNSVDGLEFYDLYGNKCSCSIEHSNNRTIYSIPFSGYVVSLKVPNAKREALFKALQAATVDADKDRLLLDCGITLTSATEADVRIENNLSRDQTFKVRIGDGAETEMTLKAREGRTLRAKMPETVPSDRFAAVRLPISFKTDTGDFTKDYEARAIAVPYQPGDRPDWSKLADIPLEHRHSINKEGQTPNQPTGPDDCAVSMRMAWNEKHLWMRVVAKDDKFFALPWMDDPWQQSTQRIMAGYSFDGLQMFFDGYGNAVEKARRGVTGHDYDDFSYEFFGDTQASNAVPVATCFRRFAPDHQLTFGVSEHKFHHNVVVPEVPVRLEARDGLVVYEVDLSDFYLKPLQLKEGNAPGFGIEYYDRDVWWGVYPKLKYSNVPYPAAWKHPDRYPRLIFVK